MTGATNGSGPKGPAPVLKAEREEWRRGTCPLCGSDVVSNAYHIGGRGIIIFHECMGTLPAPEQKTCDYRIEFAPGREPKVIGRAAGIGR